MNKLGFAVKVASQGAGNAIECNSGQWLKKVIDIRDYLKMFTGLSGTDNIVTFISFDTTGCYVTLLRSISGRVGDFLSGWIYIPNNLDIDGSNVIAAYNFAKRVLGESNLKSISGEIESFFATEYQEKEYSMTYHPSSGETFGVRYLGLYNLKELLGSNRYQMYYSGYKAIFLLNKDDEVKITKDAAPFFKDLTDFDMENYCILKSPSKDALYFLGKGVKIYLDNDKEMTSNVSCKQGDLLNISAKREGLEPLKLQITVDKEVMDFPIVKNPIWKKRISHSLFKAIDKETRNPIKLTKIIVNKTDISFNDYIFDENDCRDAKVTLKASGYAELSVRMNLLSNEIHKFEMSRESQSRSYTILMTNGYKADISLESKHIPSTADYGSPIRGYKFDEFDKNLLRPSSWYDWKQRLWGFLGCIAALLLFGLYQYLTSDDTPGNPEGANSVQTDSNKVNNDNQKVEDKETKEIDYREAALRYLNSSEQWNRDSLEAYPLTKGLYDKINKYNFESLTDLNIEDIEAISRIESLSKEMVNNGFKITDGINSKNGTITVSSWLNTVREKYSKKQKEEIEKQQGGSDVGFLNNIGGNDGKKIKPSKPNKDNKNEEEKNKKDNRGGDI